MDNVVLKKRKPGRPSKELFVPAQEENVAIVPKKRGRPKKSVDTPVVSAPVSKRGRPAKTKSNVGYCPLMVTDTIRISEEIINGGVSVVNTTSIKIKDILPKNTGIIGFIPVFATEEQALKVSDDIEEIAMSKGKLPILTI